MSSSHSAVSSPPFFVARRVGDAPVPYFPPGCEYCPPIFLHFARRLHEYLFLNPITGPNIAVNAYEDPVVVTENQNIEQTRDGGLLYRIRYRERLFPIPGVQYSQPQYAMRHIEISMANVDGVHRPTIRDVFEAFDPHGQLPRQYEQSGHRSYSFVFRQDLSEAQQLDSFTAWLMLPHDNTTQFAHQVLHLNAYNRLSHHRGHLDKFAQVGRGEVDTSGMPWASKAVLEWPELRSLIQDLGVSESLRILRESVHRGT